MRSAVVDGNELTTAALSDVATGATRRRIEGLVHDANTFTTARGVGPS